jgi:hypothetical protein
VNAVFFEEKDCIFNPTEGSNYKLNYTEFPHLILGSQFIRMISVGNVVLQGEI